jgi:hypothetical protein
MKKISPFLLLRVFLFIILASVIFQPVFAQKDILLYSSDITKWGAINGSGASADDVSPATGEGEGFKLAGKPVVNPSGTLLGDVGFFTHSSGTTTVLEFPPFTFIAGGAIEILIIPSTTSNSRNLSIPGANAVMIEGPVPTPQGGRYDRIGIGTGTTISTNMMGANNTTLDPSKVGVYHNGSSWISSGGDKPYIVTFRFPATFTGRQVIKLGENDWHKDIAIGGIKVFTAVGTTPYVASTNYPQAPSGGLVMKGTVGGAAQSGTVVNNPINIKGWNIGANDVKLTIMGDDAVKFSFIDDAINGFALQPDGSLIVSNAKVTTASGTPIDVKFTPSVRTGISNALLKIEEIGGTSSPYIVSLTGLTGGVNPQILADTATVAFWGSLISKNTKTIDIAGINLMGDVTLSITGADAEKFSCSTFLIPKQTALNGASVAITYTADISESTANAVLEIKSNGAATVYVPLAGYTSYDKPEMLELKFVVSPAGSGLVAVSPKGTSYLKGAIVTAEVIPEMGYSISYWSDAAGNHSSKRTFRVTDTKQGTITIVLVKNQGIITGPSSWYVAYSPDETKGQINANGFLAQWTTLHDTDETTNPVVRYEVVVYDSSNAEISRINAGIANSIQVNGLTQGNFYRYEVVAVKTDNTKKTTDRLGTIQTTTTPIQIICGE